MKYEVYKITAEETLRQVRDALTQERYMQAVQIVNDYYWGMFTQETVDIALAAAEELHKKESKNDA